MRKRISMMLLASLTTVIASGCCASLGRNIWVGFGESIGAVPASFLVNFLANTFGIDVQA
ncbi:MAG: hypothetical protein KBH81_04475 [Phycisphaerae bacterium]|mgnify:FL=1|nr:hypothetical protein [Phycisphaerae bacterium]HOO17302.1 hypothetical protein [Phycisphaerae bacterium]HPC22292.1 hypothetical protein [Phycisphaerae bacterium]HRS28804.1 hypothetical protein [Phycisphaerae bacterium]HRT41545.1 hypothetical protein [Phycisphaerae bacterium]